MKNAHTLSLCCTDYLDTPINKTIDSYCLEKIMEQYAMPNLFSVKRQFESKYLMLHLPKSNEECTKCILPNFFLTCVVSIKDGKFLKCICGMFERWGFPCCHIYTVLQRSPLASNIIP